MYNIHTIITDYTSSNHGGHVAVDGVRLQRHVSETCLFTGARVLRLLLSNIVTPQQVSLLIQIESQLINR